MTKKQRAQLKRCHLCGKPLESDHVMQYYGSDGAVLFTCCLACARLAELERGRIYQRLI